MQRYTDATITASNELRAALAEVRRRGYALLPGHAHPEATGIAVPVRNGIGEVIAALSVIVPNDGGAARHVPVLEAASRGVGRALAGGQLHR